MAHLLLTLENFKVWFELFIFLTQGGGEAESLLNFDF